MFSKGSSSDGNFRVQIKRAELLSTLCLSRLSPRFTPNSLPVVFASFHPSLHTTNHAKPGLLQRSQFELNSVGIDIVLLICSYIACACNTLQFMFCMSGVRVLQEPGVAKAMCDDVALLASTHLIMSSRWNKHMGPQVCLCRTSKVSVYPDLYLPSHGLSVANTGINPERKKPSGKQIKYKPLRMT